MSEELDEIKTPKFISTLILNALSKTYDEFTPSPPPSSCFLLSECHHSQNRIDWNQSHRKHISKAFCKDLNSITEIFRRITSPGLVWSRKFVSSPFRIHHDAWKYYCYFIHDSSGINDSFEQYFLLNSTANYPIILVSTRAHPTKCLFFHNYRIRKI